MKIATAFIVWMWAVFALNLIIPYDFNNWGLVPRSLWGLVGIGTSPFLHGGLGHIMSNTIPLFVMICLVGATAKEGVEAIGGCIFTGGILLWIFGTTGVHIGASGLVYALAVYLIVSGWQSKHPVKMLVAVGVVFFYSGLIWGILPTNSGISWDGHLLGGIGGGIVAIAQSASPKNNNTKNDGSNFGEIT